MKFPKIFHVPWSPGVSREDKVHQDIQFLLNHKVVITEKADGSNVCLSHEDVHARSVDGAEHETFDMLKADWAKIKYLIPRDYYIYCEWLYAKHSIQYFQLPSYILTFAVYYDTLKGEWLSWDNVKDFISELGLITVPELKVEIFKNTDQIKDMIKEELLKGSHLGGEDIEGIVLWRTDGSQGHDNLKAAKWVRKGHVQTDEHWKNQKLVKNRLKEGD